MAYVTVSHWNATQWTDEMESEAGKFVPLIMACGASTVQLVRTGDLSMCVITQYDDEEKANAAQKRIAELRAQAASEFPMTMSSAHAGSVFSGS
jgi:hypothetical protein